MPSGSDRLFGKLISGRAQALAPRQRPAAFQFLRHELPKVAEQLMFASCQFPWSRVEQAKRPHANTFLHVQGLACVESNAGRASHEWIFGEASVEQSIGHHQHLTVCHGVRAER
jgi:hypothetical protein